MNAQQRNKRSRVSVGTYVTLGIALVFSLSAALLLLAIHNRLQTHILHEAEVEARQIFQQSQAIRSYFLDILGRNLPAGRGSGPVESLPEEVPRSSMFSARDVNRLLKLLSGGDYIYRELLLDARAPGDDADEIDRELVGRLISHPQTEKVSDVRLVNGRYCYVVAYRRDSAAGDVSGSSRGPGGSLVGSVPGAAPVVSIRIPLAGAYERTARLIRDLSWMLVLALVVFFILLYLVNRFVVIQPLRRLRDNVLALIRDEQKIGVEISMPGSSELYEVAGAFNILSKKLCYQINRLEETVALRTLELEKSMLDLRASEQRYRLLVENAIEGICVIQDGYVTFHSPRMSEITGCSSSELSAMPFVDLIHPEDRRKIVEDHARLLAGEDFSPLSTLRISDKNGRIRWIEMHAVVVDWEGTPAILSFSYEITERKRMEDRLVIAEKMTTIAGLAAGVAHEINTPLSAILQSSRVILDSFDENSRENRRSAARCGVDLVGLKKYFRENEVDFFLDGIRSSAMNASRIINNLLEFSRPRKGEVERVSINELLDKSLELSRNDYQLRKRYDIINIRIRRDYAPDLPPVMCVPVEMEQVFLHLLKNAVQAVVDAPGDEEPRIIIRTLLKGRSVRIEIEDNGPGVSREVRQKIFDPFFTTKEVGIGTGLGLSVSYAIVHEKHGGALWVQPEGAGGAIFIVELPIEQDAESVTTEG